MRVWCLCSVRAIAILSTQAVKMNPYAALCNQMLSDAVAKLRSGERS